MKRRTFATSAILMGLTLSSCISPPPTPVVEKEPTGETTSITNEEQRPSPTSLPIRVQRDIEFVPGGGAYQSLDVYLPPEGEGPFPTFLAIHGGAFRARSKSIYNFVGNHLAGEGYAFVSTNYRLSQKASYPAQVEDVFCALAWVHANQDVYGFDPEQI
jgi:acetyl esterase/lipase